MYFGDISVGSTNNIVPYSLAELSKAMIDRLPPGLYFLGNVAFPLGERLFTPFLGMQRHSNLYHNLFNFYL